MLWRRISKAAAACLVLLAASGALRCASTAVSKPLRSMLICHFSGAGDYQSRRIGAALGRMLCYRASNLSQLSNLPPKLVVDRALRQEGLGRDMVLNAVNARKVAAAAGQEWVVVGSVRRADSNLFIVTTEIYGVVSGRMIGAPVVTSGTQEQLPAMEVELARNLLGGAGIPLTPQQKTDLGKALTVKPLAISLLGDYLLASEQDAPKILAKLTDADPDFPVAGLCRVDAAYRSGRSWETLTLARRFKARFPRNKDFASYEFGALATMKRFGEAAIALDQIEVYYPESFCLVWLRSQLNHLEGKYWSALQFAKRLVELNPASPEGYARIASAALESGMRLGDELALGAVTAGQAGEFAAAIDAACKAGEQAVELDPKYEEVWLTLMAAYRERGDYAKSLATYRRVMAVNPKTREAKPSLALTYLCWNKTDLAKTAAQSALVENPNLPEALVTLALCAKNQNDQKTAASCSKRALALDKRCGDVSYLRYQKLWPIQMAQQAGRLAPKSRAGG